MKSTFHNWVLNVIAVTNPTQYTKSANYDVKTQKSKWIKNRFIFDFAYFLVLLIRGVQNLAARPIVDARCFSSSGARAVCRRRLRPHIPERQCRLGRPSSTESSLRGQLLRSPLQWFSRRWSTFFKSCFRCI